MFDIPIILNNRNRLTTTRRLVKSLVERGYHNIIILDNQSTYEPLLQWYDKYPEDRLRKLKNMGQLAVYDSGEINRYPVGSWIAYSDSDIELGESTPHNFIEIMAEKANKYHFSKIGLSLKVDDLPDTEYANWVKGWESKFWEKKLEEDLYVADVDTTFSLIKVGLPFTYTSLRIGGRFTARHLPWYLDYDNLSEEEKYVINHSDGAYSTTRRFVNSLINK